MELFLPDSIDDTSACLSDVTAAAEVCAQCNNTLPGFELYNRYLSSCIALGVIDGKVESHKGSNNTGTPVIPQSGSALDQGGEDIEGAGSKIGSQNGTSSQKSTSSVSSSHRTASDRSPTSTQSRVIPGSAISVGATGSGTTETNGAVETGEPVLMAEDASASAKVDGLLTSMPTKSASATSTSSTKLLSEAIETSDSVSNGSATNDTNDTLSTVKPEWEKAMLATKLFFSFDIAEGCKQDEDGCTGWQKLTQVSSLYEKDLHAGDSR